MRSDPKSGNDGGECITFAHLSDPHLTSPEGAGFGELCNKRALSYLSWRRRRRFLHDPAVLERLVADLGTSGPTHLAITGDLTNLGLPGECREAHEWLQSLAPPQRISLVPGNHDRLIDAAWEDTVGLWSAFMESDPGVAPSGTPTAYPSLKIRGPVAFIGLCSAVPTPPLLATGRLGREQLRRLAEVLENTGHNGLFRAVLIHHPPVPGAYKWRKRLVDAESAADVIRTHGAELVLHGHTHRIIRNSLRGPDGRSIPVVGLASASSTETSPERASRYSLWTVTIGSDGSRSLTHRSRRHDSESGAYVECSDWNPLEDSQSHLSR